MVDIKTLDSRIVYQNKWMTVREDEIQRSSGAKGIFGVVEKPDFVVIVPIHDRYIHIVEQYRYPVRKRCWELPQGSWEHAPNSNHLEIANGELIEETGLISHNMIYISYQYLACGYSNQGYHIYLATNLEQKSRRLNFEEEDLTTKKVSLDEFEEMIISGMIMDATSINAYLLVKLKGMI